MTQDEIIEIARQAGFDEHHAKFDTRIETFAKLMAEAEREACAKVCESYLSESPYSWGGTTIAAAIRARGQA